MKKNLISFMMFAIVASIPAFLMSSIVDSAVTATATISSAQLPAATMTLTVTGKTIAIPTITGTGKVIDETGQKRIRDNIPKVKIGDDINTVIELLGEPSILLKKNEKRAKNQKREPKTIIVLI